MVALPEVIRGGKSGWLKQTNVAFGSKPEKLTASKCRPLFIQ
jgi:hypothetical protein